MAQFELAKQKCYILTCIYIYIYMQHHNDTMIKDEGRPLILLERFERVLWGFTVERELETEQKLQYIDPHSYGRQRCVFLVLQGYSARGPRGPSSLLDDGFLYCILSPTGLQNSIGGPEGPFRRVWLSLPHLVSNVSDPQLSDFLS